jgi:Raf kinase inhibitor-like YbhB/YbcL family protein
LFDLPPQLKLMDEGVPAKEQTNTEPMSGSTGSSVFTIRQGTNDFGKIGYGGPCPPGGTHRYFFRLYALDYSPGLTSSATRSDLLKAIRGHIVAEGRLMGKYSRGGADASRKNKPE